MERERIGRLMGTAGAVVLGAVLLVAAVAKALDPAAFAQQITAESLAGWLPAETVALIAIALEVALGLLLLLDVRRTWVLAPAAGLVAFFVFLTGRAYWRFLHGTLPEDASCGCFGNLVERTPAEAFWQDAVLLIVPLGLAFVGRAGAAALPKWRLAAAALATTGAVVFAWLAPDLPLDDVATRLSPGTELDELCAGADPRVCLTDVAPELQEGERWVVLLDLEKEPEAWIDHLNQRALDGEGPPVMALTAATPEQLHAFTWQWGPSFEIREAPAPVLRPLYRTLPRSFLSRDGVVVETVSGLPATDGETTES